MSDDPKQLEAQYLNDLNQRCNQFKEYTLSLYGPFTLGQLAGIVQTLANWEQTFRSFIPYAESLRMAGYPKLSQNLKAALNGCYIHAQAYQQMHQSQIMTEQRLSNNQHNQAQRLANLQANQAQMAQRHANFMTQMNNQANQRHKRFMSAMFGHCLGCGTPIGVSNAYCINCAQQ